MTGQASTHFVRSINSANGQVYNWTGQIDPGDNVSSFGQDGRGELYIVTLGGRLFRIVQTP